MGSRSHPHRVLYVWVCVSRCLWVCVIEADSLQLRVITVGYIRSCHAVFLVRSLQCLPCSGRRLRSVSCSGFAIPEPCCLPGLRSPETHLPIASLRYPPLPTKNSTLVSLIVLLLVINSLFSATESSRLHCDRRIWPIFMDSAETRGLQELLAGNNARMDLQEENMLNTGRAVQALVAQVSELTTQVQLLRSPAAPPTPPSFSIPGNHSPQHEPRLPAPEMYAGDPNLCRAFLTKCSLFFSLQPLTFATEVSRVAFTFTFTFMHLADAFIQSDLQLHPGYTFSLVCVFPGNRTHNLLRHWRNALPLSHTGTLVALVLTLLSGKAALWGTAVWENCHPCCSSFRSLS